MATATDPPGPVRVLQVCTRFPPDMGGLETHVSEISRRLARHADINVTVLATDRHGTLPLQEVTTEGVTVHRRRAWPAGSQPPGARRSPCRCRSPRR